MEGLVAIRQHLAGFHSTSGVYVIELIHREAQLHAKWYEVKSSPTQPSSRQELQAIMQEALELDGEFQSWEGMVPSTWRYQMERNTPQARSTYDPKWRDLILDGTGAPEEIHSYPSLKRCWIWMFYRTSRLFLLRDLVEILNWMFRLPEVGTTGPSINQPSATASTPLDNVALSIHHSFATTHLVTLIEKICSAILGSFTVPIPGKSNDDVVGMRGYICVWPLGAVDSVLQSGLVPDSGTLPAQPNSAAMAPKAPSPLDFSQFHNRPAPSPSVFKHASQTIHPLYHNPATAVPDPQDFPRLPAISSSVPPVLIPTISVSLPDIGTGSGAGPTEPQHKHSFDVNAPHPFDHPANLPALEFSITKVHRIDVAARREWIHRLLYYMGTRLGIKKGLAVVFGEGYADVSKREVDRVFGPEGGFSS